MSTPIRWYWAITAPLMTLPTISTAITRPISANASTNGSMMAALLPSDCCALSHDPQSRTDPAGRAFDTTAASARSCASVAERANRYSS